MTPPESSNTHTGKQIRTLDTTNFKLTDEPLFLWRIYQPQSLLPLLIIIALAVSIAMLFCNRGSTSSNPVSLGGVRGGRGFLVKYLRSTSQDDDLSIPLPPVMTEQLPPSRDSLTPTSYLLLNFLPCSLVNSGMCGNDYSPILCPRIPAITLHCAEKHLARGEYAVSTLRLVIRWTML